MADNEGARETGEAIVMCTKPDVCMSGSSPVPYQIIARFDSVVDQVDDVRMTGMCTMTMASRITKVTGDEGGSGGGLASGVNLGYCRPITHSTTVRSKGEFLIYHSSTYWMNCAGPDGPGNTQGKVIYVETVDCVYLGPLGQIEGDTSGVVTPETPEEKSWWESAWGATAKWAQDAHLVERGIGVIQAVGGLGEVAAGIAAVEIPPLGAAIFAHGVDNTWTGLRQISTGEWQQTYTEQGAKSIAEGLGASPETAETVGVGVDMIVGMLDPINDLKKGVETSIRQAEKKAVRQAEKKAAEDIEKKAILDAEKKEAEKIAQDGVQVSKKELNNLKPNTTYKVDGYTYKTDELGRVERVEGELRLDKAERNKYRQRTSGGDDRLPTDHGGHLVGSEFGGTGEGINLVPQDAKLNQGEWKKMEKEWSTALKENKKVTVDMKTNYPEGSLRPDSFEVEWSIDGTKKKILFTNGD